jgi:hypothetical protein
MRKCAIGLCAAALFLAGCGGSAPVTSEATPEDEKAAQERIKEEAARELKARQAEKKNKQPNPADQ